MKMVIGRCALSSMQQPCAMRRLMMTGLHQQQAGPGADTLTHLTRGPERGREMEMWRRRRSRVVDGAGAVQLCNGCSWTSFYSALLVLYQTLLFLLDVPFRIHVRGWPGLDWVMMEWIAKARSTRYLLLSTRRARPRTRPRSSSSSRRRLVILVGSSCLTVASALRTRTRPRPPSPPSACPHSRSLAVSRT